MEYWLISTNNTGKLQLPVPPNQDMLSEGNNNTTVNIVESGEINLMGKRRLSSITLDSFFPAQEYSFCQYKGFPKPYECAKMINAWRLSGKPIRLIITQTDINMLVSIENFTHGEQDGTGDVYFSLELKEYRLIGNFTVSQKNIARPISKSIPKTYNAKKGETLYQIAKKTTGNGANWKKISAQNGKAAFIVDHGRKYVL